MGYETDLCRDETANQLCTLMGIYNQIGRNLLDFGMDDEDNMAGRVKVRWKEQMATIAGSDSEAQEGEDSEEINELFKKIERTAVEIELVLENVMTELEVVAELNQLLKPTINKLKKLSLHGVLSLLKNWPEPLPVGSLPNINVRVAVLKILDYLPIDLKQHHRGERFKRSGLGKVIMFLSKFDEETTANRKLFDEERVPQTRDGQLVKARENVARVERVLAEKGLESECIETIQAIGLELSNEGMLKLVTQI